LLSPDPSSPPAVDSASPARNPRVSKNSTSRLIPGLVLDVEILDDIILTAEARLPERMVGFVDSEVSSDHITLCFEGNR